MDEARVQTSGAELVSRRAGGAGGAGVGSPDVEAPNIGGDNAAATSGISPGFDAKKQWITAKRKVLVVRHTTTEIQTLEKKFKSGPAIYQIVRSNFRKAVVSRPELYLEASFETFLFMVACTWVTTCIWNPDVLLASKGGNRINDIFSYNNVCVGFDTSPARYVAQPLFALQSFLGVRFGNLDLLRLNLEWIAGRVDKIPFYFSATMDILFMATMLLWPMLLIITPDSGGFGLNYHFYVYVIFVVIMYLTILAQFTTAPKHLVPLISKIWVGVYGVWTLLLLLIGFVAFNSYDYARCPSDQVNVFRANGTHAEYCQQDPAVPVAIMSVLDYGWFILLLFATPLLPYSPALNIPVSLVVDDHAKPVGYLANIDVKENARIAAEATKKATAIAKVKGKEATAIASVKAKEVKGQVQKKVDDYKAVSAV